MAHERHADFLQDTGLHQARVEGVAEIMKADVADPGVFERGLPLALGDANWSALEAGDESFRLTDAEERLRQPLGKRDLPGFALGRFRAGDEQQRAGEVD